MGGDKGGAGTGAGDLEVADCALGVYGCETGVDRTIRDELLTGGTAAGGGSG